MFERGGKEFGLQYHSDTLVAAYCANRWAPFGSVRKGARDRNKCASFPAWDNAGTDFASCGCVQESASVAVSVVSNSRILNTVAALSRAAADVGLK